MISPLSTLATAACQPMTVAFGHRVIKIAAYFVLED